MLYRHWFLTCFRISHQEGPRKSGRHGTEWTHQLLDRPHDLKIMDENINTIKKNTEALLGTSREVGLEVYTENEVYGPVSSPESRITIYWFPWKCGNVHIFENNSIQEEIKRTWNSGNACCHSVQKVFCLPFTRYFEWVWNHLEDLSVDGRVMLE